MDKLMKQVFVGGVILIIFTLGICYKIRLNSEDSMKAAFETVKAQNEDLKAELCNIKDLLQQQAKQPSYSWSASNTSKTDK